MFEFLQKFYSSLATFIEISTLVFFPEDDSQYNINEKANSIKTVEYKYIENIVKKNIHKILDEDFDEMDIKISSCLEDIDEKLEIHNTRLNLLEKKVKNLTELIKISMESHEKYDYSDIKPYQDLTHPLNWQDEHITTDNFRETDLIDVTISDNLKNNDYEVLMRAYETSFAIVDDDTDKDDDDTDKDDDDNKKKDT